MTKPQAEAAGWIAASGLSAVSFAIVAAIFAGVSAWGATAAAAFWAIAYFGLMCLWARRFDNLRGRQ